MKTADMQVYKRRLELLRRRLRGDVKAMAKSALHGVGEENGGTASMPIHMAELATENFEIEFTLSLLETEEDTLTSVKEAIMRVDEGVFGKCLGCDGAIPKSRLNALPHAAMCVKCAEIKEAG